MAQNLTTNIVINARTGNGFSEVGNTLTELGSIVNGLSQQLINFGTDSAKVYRDYEKSMKDAEVALSTTYGRGTMQLSRVMAELDTAATEWAATTIFHTNDVANAISEAAHAGWDLDQILNGMPAAMQLAQAGSMDLSEAVNFIVKTTNAAGIGFEDLNNFTDLWTFAANSSATTIEEMGEAMLRMGSTMKFAGGTEELLTLIAVTANAGSVGSEAGTMIRNSMMRLVSPTKKATDVMNELGATADEISEIMNDTALAETNAELAARGFSVYDSSGQLRSSLDIYTDLAAVMAEIAGGYENIGQNETTLKMLGSIFPTRTITEALNLINAAANGWDGLYDAMMGGEAGGYGQYAATTMMDSLYGSTETFESKVERLKQLVGEELAPQIETVLGFAGNLVDSLAEMDPSAFSAIVSGLEVVAAAGPALLLAGGAIRLIGALANPVGLTAVAVIALAAGVKALGEFKNSQFLEDFGTMSLDTGAITSQLSELGDSFRSVYQETYAFRHGIEEAVKSYQTASGDLSSSLFTKMVAGMKLTEEDKKTLNGFAEEMHNALTEAITSNYGEQTSFWTAFFGGTETAEGNQTYQNIVGAAGTAYDEAMAQAQELGNGLKEAMTSAFEDGQISDEEYQKILSYMQSYNEAIARAAAEAESREAQIALQTTLRKAQNASAEQLFELSENITEQRDTLLAEQQELFDYNYSAAQIDGASQADLDELQRMQDAKMAEMRAPYDQALLSMWTSQIAGSDQGQNYEWMQDIARRYRSGEITAETADAAIRAEMGKSVYADQNYLGLFSGTTDRESLGRMTGSAVAALGGTDQILSLIAGYQSAGNTGMADMLSQLLTVSSLLNDFETVTKATADSFQTSAQGITKSERPEEAQVAAAVINQSDYSTDNARNAAAFSGGIEDYLRTVSGISQTSLNPAGEVMAAWNQLSRTQQAETSNLVSQLMSAYDFERAAQATTNPNAQGESTPVRNEAIAYELMYGELAGQAESFRITVEPIVDQAQIDDQMPDSVQMAVDPVLTSNPGADLTGFSTTVTVNSDTSALGEAQAQADQYVTTHFEADTTPVEIAVADIEGTPISKTVVADASQAIAAISAITAQDGRVITITVREVTEKAEYAEGGRAVTASIFGEAGPEWAIPEEHTERTAELLNEARAASGFSWGELLQRFGGLNAGTGGKPTTIVYSPTINAKDVTGVEQALKADKERLEQWFRDKALLNEVEVYT